MIIICSMVETKVEDSHSQNQAKDLEKDILFDKNSDNIFIGTSQGKPLQYPIDNLKKHFVSLGASGSGKTVLSKVLIEECAMKNIPSIVIDVQGDLSALAILGKKDDIIAHDLSEAAYDHFKKNVETVIFTPVSSKGIPICINPLMIEQNDLPEEEMIPILHSIGTSLAKLLGYSISNDKGKSAEAILYTVLKHSYDNNEKLETFANLAKILKTTGTSLYEDVSVFAKDEKELNNLIRKLKFMDVGEKKLLFQFGIPSSIDFFLKSETPGKTRISILYLNTLRDQSEKEFFLSNITTSLYQWMLDNPSDSVQCAYLIDEIAPFLPAGSEKPMTKSILKMLFKQARKYGVACMIATQNPGDIDYKAFSQFGSWAIGRLSVKQDIKKIEKALSSLTGSQDLMSTLPKLQSGQFLLFSPDISSKLIDMRVRWLYTVHKTLNEDAIKELMSSIQKNFKKYFITQKKKTKTHQEIRESIEKDAQELIQTVSERNSNPIEKKKIISNSSSDTSNLSSNNTSSNTSSQTKDKNNLTHFFTGLDYRSATEFALKKRHRMFYFFGPLLEQIVDVTQVMVPMVQAKIQVKESSYFGFVKKIFLYSVFYDANSREIVHVKESSHNHLHNTKNLLDLTENQLIVGKTVMQAGKKMSVAEIVHRTSLTQSAVTKALNILTEKSIVTFEKISKYKHWYSISPLKSKNIRSIASKRPQVTDREATMPLPKVDIISNDIASFIRIWFKDAQVIESHPVYLPEFIVSYTRKGVVRKIRINGATKKIRSIF